MVADGHEQIGFGIINLLPLFYLKCFKKAFLQRIFDILGAGVKPSQIAAQEAFGFLIGLKDRLVFGSPTIARLICHLFPFPPPESVGSSAAHASTQPDS